ncbi:hypothetical protein R1sor_013764 [Riccia sorocarpa]|uniref:Uncharacterized protein n=1 Tax=Riccia sorocarpa TaxID=122646 RepID=A0ABD3HB61_9MARC
MIESKQRNEQEFKEGLERLEREMKELREFYLKQKGFSDSPVRTEKKEANASKENGESPPFDFVEAYNHIQQGSIDALLDSGYTVIKDPPPKKKRVDELPDYIDLFDTNEYEPGTVCSLLSLQPAVNSLKK